MGDPIPKVHWWCTSCTSTLLYSTLSDYSPHYVRVYLAALVHGHGLRPTRTQFLRRKFTVITASWRHLSGVHYKYLFATLKKNPCRSRTIQAPSRNYTTIQYTTIQYNTHIQYTHTN